MGKKNKQRRKPGRPVQPASTPRAHPAFGIYDVSDPASFGAPMPPRQPPPEEVVATLVSTAIQAYVHNDGPTVQAAIEALVERPDLGNWRSITERALTLYLSNVIAAAWKHGWQPADVARIVGRRFGNRHVRLVTDVIAADLQSYSTVTLDPRWPAQLAELEAEVWWRPEQTYLRAWCELPNNDWVTVIPMAVELIAQLNSLPALEQLGPLPGTARPPVPRAGNKQAAAASPGGSEKAVDERMLSRIRNLLAKAEATGFPAEAEALTAAAQERMARYSIDAAMLAATATVNKEAPGGRRIGIDNPYEAAKAVLLSAVAKANRCRSVWTKYLGFCTVIGFDPDLDAVEALFTSLLVQATTAVNAAGAGSGAGARTRTRAFRQSFLTAYAHRIGERLSEITREQTEVASAEPGGGNLLPVLASRDREVENTVSQLFPDLTQSAASSITDAAGWHSGRGAADLAVLHNGQALPE